MIGRYDGFIFELKVGLDLNFTAQKPQLQKLESLLLIFGLYPGEFFKTKKIDNAFF